MNAGAFKKGEKRPNQGRPKGSLNKATMAAKEAIALAAEGLGGKDRLIAWAQEDALNERAFWSSIYPRLLPVQMASDPDNPMVIQLIARTVIDPVK